MDDGKMRGYVFFLKIFKFSVWRVNKDADTQLLRFDTHLFFFVLFLFYSQSQTVLFAFKELTRLSFGGDSK